MIFLIEKVNFEHHVIIYESTIALTQRVEWQDIYEGKSIIIDEKGIEYKWDSSKKNEIGSVYHYTLIPTSKVSKLLTKCLMMANINKDIGEFNF